MTVEKLSVLGWRLQAYAFLVYGIKFNRFTLYTKVHVSSAVDYYLPWLRLVHSSHLLLALCSYQHPPRLWRPHASVLQLLSVYLEQLLHALRQVRHIDLGGGASHHFLQAADPLHVVQSLLNLLEAIGSLHA